MGSSFGDWPSFDPHNFSQLRPSDPSKPSKMTPITYLATHERTLPPPDQVVTTEPSILLRHLYQPPNKLKLKRPAADNLNPEHGTKLARSAAF